MISAMKIVLLFLFSVSAFGGMDCELFAGRACVYHPQNATSTSLQLYIRGHYNGQRDLPVAQRTEVAKATLTNPKYHLTGNADRTGSFVVSTGSSAVVFTLADIKAIEEKYQLTFKEITISAHSGGYFGLNKTLNELTPLLGVTKQILMLDNFYATTEDGLLKNLRHWVNQGVSCRGFMTEHNAARVSKHYQGLCAVDGPKGMDHDASVGPFLDRFL